MRLSLFPYGLLSTPQTHLALPSSKISNFGDVPQPHICAFSASAALTRCSANIFKLYLSNSFAPTKISKYLLDSNI